MVAKSKCTFQISRFKVLLTPLPRTNKHLALLSSNVTQYRCFCEILVETGLAVADASILTRCEYFNQLNEMCDGVTLCGPRAPFPLYTLTIHLCSQSPGTLPSFSMALQISVTHLILTSPGIKNTPIQKVGGVSKGMRSKKFLHQKEHSFKYSHG